MIMVCSCCGAETDDMKGNLCRKCFIVDKVNDYTFDERDYMPEEYYMPVTESTATIDTLRIMSIQYQERLAEDRLNKKSKGKS